MSSLFSIDELLAPEVPRIAFSIFPNESNVTVVFSSTHLDWPYVSAYLDRIFNATSFYQRYLISKLILQSCDNFVISPDYFDLMPTTQQGKLCQFYTDTILTIAPSTKTRTLFVLEEWGQ